MASHTMKPDSIRQAFQNAFAAEKDKVVREEVEKAQAEVSRRMVEFANRMTFNIHTHYDIAKDRESVDVILTVRDG